MGIINKSYLINSKKLKKIQLVPFGNRLQRRGKRKVVAIIYTKEKQIELDKI
jgi:hypothetical protein